MRSSSVSRSAQAALSLVFALSTTLAVGCAPGADEGIEEAESAQSTEAAATVSEGDIVVPHQYQVQQTGYWCGPSATRVVLSTRMSSPPSQQQLANELPTDTGGTDWIGQVTRVLNKYIGNFITVEMPNDPPTAAQKSRLWTDLTRSVDNGYGIVANIVAPASNHPPGYPNRTIYHYIAVVGYNASTQKVFIADSANFGGYKEYWLSFNQLSTLIPPKGYSAWNGPVNVGTTCPGGNGTVLGAIETKYKALGGCSSFLGVPVTEQIGLPSGGKYSAFQNGTIYWSQASGANEVHGPIRDRYRDMGWETSILKYPTADQAPTSDGRGQKSIFQGGVLYWSEATGAHEVYGDIRAKWNELGAETSQLGLPTSGEYGVTGGRRNDFEHGYITWKSSNRQTTVTYR